MHRSSTWAEASQSGGLRINLGHLGVFKQQKLDTRAFLFLLSSKKTATINCSRVYWKGVSGMNEMLHLRWSCLLNRGRCGQSRLLPTAVAKKKRGQRSFFFFFPPNFNVNCNAKVTAGQERTCWNKLERMFKGFVAEACPVCNTEKRNRTNGDDRDVLDNQPSR